MRTNGVNSCSIPKGEDWCSSLKAVKQNDFFFSLLVLSRPSTDWIRPTHIGEDYYFISFPIQMLISSKKTLTDSSRAVFNQISGCPMAQLSWYIKLTFTRSYHNAWHRVKRRVSGDRLHPFKWWLGHLLVMWHWTTLCNIPEWVSFLISKMIVLSISCICLLYKLNDFINIWYIAWYIVSGKYSLLLVIIIIISAK